LSFFAGKVIGDLYPQFGHYAAVCVSLQQLHVQESQGRSNKNDSRLPAHGNKPSDIPVFSLRRGVFTYSLSLSPRTNIPPTPHSLSSISMCFHLSPPYCSHVHLELSKRARASSLGADGPVICALVHRRREGPRNDNKDLCAKCAVGVSLISWFLLRRRRSWRDNGKMDYFALGCWRWSIARGNLSNESRKGEIGKILTPS
jgi:hypothetical protein